MHIDSQASHRFIVEVGKETVNETDWLASLLYTDAYQNV